MTDESKSKQPKIETLELNKETLHDLTEIQAERAEGGARQNGTVLSDCGCGSVCSYAPSGCA
jgi:hypothetical protein